MRRLLGLFLVGFVLCLSPNVALAQPKVPDEELKKQMEAQKRFEEAEKLYNIGDFEGALAGYKEAYLLSNNPDLLFNMGQCYRKLGKYDDALITYRSYLREVPNSPVKADVEARIAEVEKEKASPKLAKVIITSSPPGAEVHKGGSKTPVIGITPFTLNELPAGDHHFSLTLKGYQPYELDLTAEGGKEYIIPEAKLVPNLSYRPVWAYRLSFVAGGVANGTAFGGNYFGGGLWSYLERFTPSREKSYGTTLAIGGGSNAREGSAGLGHLSVGGTIFFWRPLWKSAWSWSYGGAFGVVGLAGDKSALGLYARGQLRLVREGEFRGAIYLRPIEIGASVFGGFGVLDLNLLGFGYSWGLRNRNPLPK